MDFASGGPQVLAEAATAEFFKIKDLNLTRGRLFSEQEDVLGSNVIVIGMEVAERYRRQLAGVVWPGLEGLSVTVSLGVADLWSLAGGQTKR